MKQIIHILLVTLLIAIFSLSSCQKDLLDQVPTGEVASSQFWKTTDDATTALNGCYNEVRRLFHRDYSFDGLGEYLRFISQCTTSQSAANGAIAYRNGGYNNPSGSYGSSFTNYYTYSYAGIQRCNYVIDHVESMVESVKDESLKTTLEGIIGEARMMRGMVYFRLITMFGDVPYIDHIVESNDEVANITRTPIAEIYQSCYDDFTYAWEHCPNRPVALGRQSKWGALAFRGKLQLYWACWNRTNWPWGKTLAPNGGWPELSTFTPNQSASDAAYKAAAADFRKVIEESGIKLYMNGEPGECGGLGDWEKLPNYYYLFTPKANDSEELMVAFTHGGQGTGLSDELCRDFGTRSTQNGQGFGQPRFSIVDRYQSTVTGDFCEPLIRLHGGNVSDAYTRKNSASNPQSYADRDYRMKASILWEGERLYCYASYMFDAIRLYRYRQLTGTISSYPPPNGAVNAGSDAEGVIMRKFVINWEGVGRSEGTYNYPVMRLADVYLMYAEAANEAYGPTGDGGLALDVVNRVRHRGNLPPLKPEKYSDKETFFSAIEQERIIELFAEGHRLWDLRRWRSIERVWCEPQTPGGVELYDSWGVLKNTYFNNTPFLNYQRMYIFAIPESERNRNSSLTQNVPWL